MEKNNKAVSEESLLQVEDLSLYYGRARVLNSVSLHVKAGEIAVLLGRNGAGKTSCLRALMGLIPSTATCINYSGTSLMTFAPHQISQLGIGYVPEDRRIFTDLTVLENLKVGQKPSSHAHLPTWSFDKIFDLFPNLAEMRHRHADKMSGGEQQMLSIARTLMGNPETLLLDEPSEGLSPIIVAQMAKALQTLKSQGMTVLLSEQNFAFSRKVADRAYIIEKGHIQYEGSMETLAEDKTICNRYLALSA